MLRLPLVRVPIPGVSVFRLHLAKRVISSNPPLSRAPLVYSVGMEALLWASLAIPSVRLPLVGIPLPGLSAARL